ncbi:unnamed protein product [Cylicostephanus goldi]|uniref:Uncharacterized protein n=1 Tax=Cylicostephanus goldi TaxID=71465 RepID=A0A3P7MNV8_CYLGO|nr:unnamed protein product [Cylicostephanus goldi]
MQYEYNLTAVGLTPRFPYISLGNCMGLDCKKPGAEIANGSADITLGTVWQSESRYEQVDFTVPIGVVYFGYVIKESTQVEVEDYIADAFRGSVGKHKLLLLKLISLFVAWHLNTQKLTTFAKRTCSRLHLATVVDIN